MRTTSPFEITVGLAAGVHLLVVKLQSAQVELNVWLTRADVENILAGIPSAPASESLTAGDSAGSKVFWAQSADGLTFVVVGHDDETWDVGITLTVEEGRDLLAKLEAGLNQATRSNISMERTNGR